MEAPNQPLDIVGLQEIAERLKVAHKTAEAWRYRRLLPDPERVLHIGPVWQWAVVRDWAEATGRLEKSDN